MRDFLNYNISQTSYEVEFLYVVKHLQKQQI